MRSLLLFVLFIGLASFSQNNAQAAYTLPARESGGLASELGLQRYIDEVNSLHKDLSLEFKDNYKAGNVYFEGSIEFTQYFKPKPATIEHYQAIQKHIKALRDLQTNLRIESILVRWVNDKISKDKQIKMGDLDPNTLERIHQMSSNGAPASEIESVVANQLNLDLSNSMGTSANSSSFLTALHEASGSSDDLGRSETLMRAAANDGILSTEETQLADRAFFGNAATPSSGGIESLGVGANEISTPTGNFGDLSAALPSPSINAPLPSGEDTSVARGPASTNSNASTEAQDLSSSSQHKGGMKTLSSPSKSDSGSGGKLPSLVTPAQPNVNLSDSTRAAPKSLSTPTSAVPPKAAPVMDVSSVARPQTEISFDASGAATQKSTIEQEAQYQKDLQKVRNANIEEVNKILQESSGKKYSGDLEKDLEGVTDPAQKKLIQKHYAEIEESKIRELSSQNNEIRERLVRNCSGVLDYIQDSDLSCLKLVKSELEKINSKVNVKFIRNHVGASKIGDLLSNCFVNTVEKNDDKDGTNTNTKTSMLRNLLREIAVQSNKLGREVKIPLPPQQACETRASETIAHVESKKDDGFFGLKNLKRRIEKVLPNGDVKRLLAAKSWADLKKEDFTKTCSTPEKYEREQKQYDDFAISALKTIPEIRGSTNGIYFIEQTRRKAILENCVDEKNNVFVNQLRSLGTQSLNSSTGFEFIKTLMSSPNVKNHNTKCLAENNLLFYYLQDIQTIAVKEIYSAELMQVSDCHSPKPADWLHEDGTFQVPTDRRHPASP